MTAILNQDFVTYAGDDVYPIFTVRDSTGAAVDISTVSEILWKAVRNDDGAVVISKLKSVGQITFVTNGTDGKFQVSILKTDTTGLTGWYRHLSTITDAGGNVTTVEVGRMQVGPRPSWTYDPSSISTTPLYQVRRLLGDVINNDQQMPDEEIKFFISQRSSIYGAAADAARALASQYSRKVDTTSPGGLSTQYGKQAQKYLDLAKQLDAQATSRGAGVIPYAGGISVADKTQVQANTDRVTPQFNLGMTDNFIPQKPVGNETPGNAASNPGP